VKLHGHQNAAVRRAIAAGYRSATASMRRCDGCQLWCSGPCLRCRTNRAARLGSLLRAILKADGRAAVRAFLGKRQPKKRKTDRRLPGAARVPA